MCNGFHDYYDTAFSIFFDIYFRNYFGSTIVPSLSKADNYYLVDHYTKNKHNAVPLTFNRIKEILLKKNKLKGKSILTESLYLNLLKSF